MKSVLISGCTKGIGYAVTKQLLATGGYKVYGIARDTSGFDLQSDHIKLYDGDLSDPLATEKLLKTIMADAKGIDIVINNAGTGVFKPIDQLTLTDWNSVMAVNVTAPFLAIKYALSGMRANNFGRIITISSDADSFSYDGASAYCASKAAAAHMANCVRKDVEGLNISVTTISPGRVDTYFNNKKPGARPNSLQPEDVARQVGFILEQEDRCEIESIRLNSIQEKGLH